MKKLPWFIATFIFLLLITGSAWYALDRIKEESLKSIENSLKTVSQITHEALYIWIKNRQESIMEIAQDEDLILLTQQLLQTSSSKLSKYSQQEANSNALTNIRALMNKKMKVHQDLGFFIISPNRINIASMRDSNLYETNVIFKKRPRFFNRMFAGETLFIPPINSDVPLQLIDGTLAENLPTMFIGSPIYDQQQNIIALLTLRIDPGSDFSRITQLGRIGDSGETYAFDEDGVLLTESRFEQQLHKIGLLPSQSSSMLSIRVADPGGDLFSGFSPKVERNQLPLTFMAKSALAGESASNVKGYRDYRGVPVFGSWIWDKALGFGLATEIDVDEALIPNYKTRNILIFVVFAVALVSLAGFFVWIIIEKQGKKELKKAYAKLEGVVAERTKELQALSYQDGLTEIGNRRMFDQSLEQEWHRAMRHQDNLSLIMIDIDFFKPYNDNYGHIQGDYCLKHVAQCLAKTSQRETDIIARYGGEEFVVLLPSTSLTQAKQFAEKCRQQIIAQQIEHQFTPFDSIKCLSISLGVSSTIPEFQSSSSTLIKQADQQLYLAKKNGRNRVE